MKKILVLVLGFTACNTNGVFAQDIKAKDVPGVVKQALLKRYPQATKVSWEKENGNYEANWGGKSGEDNAVQFSPSGEFVEFEMAIGINDLPAGVAQYIKNKYANTAIKEAGKITSASGVVTYEAEVKGKDLIFDANGNFVKVNEED